MRATVPPPARLELSEGRPRLAYPSLGGEPDLAPIDLHPLLAVTLDYLDRGWEVKDLGAHLAARLSQPEDSIHEIVEDASICFRAHLRHGGKLTALGETERGVLEAGLSGAEEPYRSRDVVFPNDRFLFPLTVQWLVTRFCNRQCIYCYQGAVAGARAKDSTLPLARIREVLREAARLGAYNFFITGGEPLLRPEAYDVIIHALEQGMAPEIVSKQFIPEEQADRLAAAGLPQIFLSIDSLDPAVARRMTGVRTYARDIRRTIERLVARDIQVNAKLVLTSENVATLPWSIEEMERLGVSWVGIEKYSRNLQRHSDHLEPSHEQLRYVGDWVESFNARNGKGLSVSFDMPAGAPTGNGTANGSAGEEAGEGADLGEDCIVCHNGITALLFLPDGRVSRCDKQLPGNEFIVGDLATQSVYEVWSSPEMVASLKPPRELYRGTLCYDCRYFEDCHQRGRCYYDAYLTSSTLFGPASNCPYVDNGVRPAC